MAAVDDFAAEAGAGDDAAPIAGYDELTVARVLPLLEGLGRAQLWQVHEYERRHANRVAILEAVERALG
jgi:hypothetical protein